MRLQYRLSNGQWVDCRDRTEEFLGYCIECHQRVTGVVWTVARKQVVDILTAGGELRNSPSDWYSYCRDGEVAERKAAARRAI